MIMHILAMMRLVSMRPCFSIRGECVTHMKLRVVSGNSTVLGYICQFDLHITYYG